MNYSRFFSRFLFYSFLIHILLFGYIVFNPSFDFLQKKDTPIKNAIQVNTISSSELEKKGAMKKEPTKKKKKMAKKPAKKPVKKAKSIKKKPAPKVKVKKQKAKKKPDTEELKETQSKAMDKIKELENIEQKQNQALDKLEAMESIEQIKKEVELSEQTNPPVPKAATEGVELGFQELKYFTSLKAHINMYWSLPQELADRNFRTEVFTIINGEGHILRGEITKSSGNADFDARVLETIERA
ncbi:MAG: TonB C-terminal domain-containing protein, partial [Bdellovibrionales bacterium]|nr:TonB C-terminal domain-containing protein [Bdellovibrionales bacterium]